MKNIMIMIAISLTLMGCARHEEKLCRTQIKSTLLNPETATFSDFESIDKKAVESDELMSGLKGYLAELVPQKGATYYRLKLRADGELGNKITKLQFCSVSAAGDQCACLSAS